MVLQTWKTGWVPTLAVLIILLHSTAAEEEYAFTNGFFHRPITRKRNNVSNKDFIPVTLIYLNTGGGVPPAIVSYSLHILHACLQMQKLAAAGVGGTL